jgi:hypothetical protein
LNILVELLQQGVGWQPGVGDHLELAPVLDQLQLRVPEPGNPDESEAYTHAEIPLRQRQRWRQIANTFSQIPDVGLLHSWTAAVTLPDNETVAFVPSDDRPTPEVIFFSAIRGRRGRLRLSVPYGPGGPITGVTFETSLHCDDMTCIDDSNCSGQCCNDCSCHESPDGLVIRLLCWCPTHGSA